MQIIILVDGIVQNFLQDIKHPAAFRISPCAVDLFILKPFSAKSLMILSTDME